MAEQLNTYAELFKKSGPWTTVYVDASTGTVDTLRAGDILPDRVGEVLSGQGISKQDLKAVEEAISPATGVPSPVSRFVLVRDGNIEVNEILPGPLAGPEKISVDSVPDLVPLMKQRGDDFPYVVAEVGRDGGEIRLQYARRNGVAEEHAVEGSKENLKKVPTGGWEQGRRQHRTEEIWRKNADEIAGAIDRVVSTCRPRLLVVAGDIRARELVVNQLSEASRSIEATVESHTRTGGADQKVFQEEVSRLVAEVWAQQQQEILSRLEMQQGQDNPESTTGYGNVVTALQQAQVERLILEDAALVDHEALALDKEPWIATEKANALDGQVLGTISAPAAMVRAAALTDAKVSLVPSGVLSEGTKVAALLRWPTGPSAS
ncbi:baeRF2 domain-containing protein [Crystallibacter degradans]|uniref:baeRF2 domain-containing protein n=1 Tax=Crystallibacter degradans TaxID=2726743 RepID=UPI001473F5C9|nr:Vms1/Ankzf1 family peptidyl-tRNA hydrolase [Arthrobacter sp. SF27]NMR30774.1 hypothetical protein [Arthrobacter sp. SF27]